MNGLINVKVLRLMRDYQMNKAYADDDFIEKAFYYILDDYNIKSDVYIGEYAYLFDSPLLDKDGNIYFKSNIDLEEKISFFNYKMDKIVIYNLLVLKKIYDVIFNLIKYKYRSNNFVDELVRMNKEFVCDIDLVQRAASIDSFNEINKYIGFLDVSDKLALYHLRNLENISALLNGYTGSDVCNSPVYLYKEKYIEYLMQERNVFACDKNISDDIKRLASSLAEDANLYYGLPIKDETYQKLIKRKNISNKILKRN